MFNDIYLDSVSNYVYHSAAFMISHEYWAEACVDVLQTPKTLFWVNMANLDSSQ